MENIEIKFGKKFMVIDGIKIDTVNYNTYAIGGRAVFYDDIKDIKFASATNTGDMKIRDSTIWIKTSSTIIEIRNIATEHIEAFFEKLENTMCGNCSEATLVF